MQTQLFQLLLNHIRVIFYRWEGFGEVNESETLDLLVNQAYVFTAFLIVKTGVNSQTFDSNPMNWVMPQESLGFQIRIFYAKISGAYRLPNNNTLICDGDLWLLGSYTIRRGCLEV
jgi:hypothetical protein